MFTSDFWNNWYYQIWIVGYQQEIIILDANVALTMQRNIFFPGQISRGKVWQNYVPKVTYRVNVVLFSYIISLYCLYILKSWNRNKKCFTLQLTIATDFSPKPGVTTSRPSESLSSPWKKRSKATLNSIKPKGSLIRDCRSYFTRVSLVYLLA